MRAVAAEVDEILIPGVATRKVGAVVSKPPDRGAGSTGGTGAGVGVVGAGGAGAGVEGAGEFTLAVSEMDWSRAGYKRRTAAMSSGSRVSNRR
jgi:hypothetical protein